MGFAQTNYTGDEGAYVEVCVVVRSLDQMALNMSDFEGHFAISGLGNDPAPRVNYQGIVRGILIHLLMVLVESF